jgi:hypothetical protein
MKRGVANTLLLRDEMHCSTKDGRDKKVACINETLMKNAYQYNETKRQKTSEDIGKKEKN